MNAVEIMQRCAAIRQRMDHETDLDQVRAALAEVRELHDTQCLRCGCSADDAGHASTVEHGRSFWRRREWSREIPAKCDYLPRLRPPAPEFSL